MDTVWATVDRLIHDLGEVRAVMDEAEALSDAAPVPAVKDLRGAMDEATDAITRIFADTQQEAIEAAWGAIARAQDAAREARASIAAARAAREGLPPVVAQARAQAPRAHYQRVHVIEPYGRGGVQGRRESAGREAPRQAPAPDPGGEEES